jgi:hypothetical protein
MLKLKAKKINLNEADRIATSIITQWKNRAYLKTKKSLWIPEQSTLHKVITDVLQSFYKSTD